jgi:hypothetical protein
VRGTFNPAIIDYSRAFLDDYLKGKPFRNSLSAACGRIDRENKRVSLRPKSQNRKVDQIIAIPAFERCWLASR